MHGSEKTKKNLAKSIHQVNNKGGVLMETLAAISGLTVRFGDVLAVDDVSFELGAQEVLAVIGPNGSGKIAMVMLWT